MTNSYSFKDFRKAIKWLGKLNMKSPIFYTLIAFGGLFSLALSDAVGHIDTTTITITSLTTVLVDCGESSTVIPSSRPISTSCTDSRTTRTTTPAPTTQTLTTPTPTTTTCSRATITITTLGDTASTTTKLPTSACAPVTVITTEPTGPASCLTRPDCPPLGLNVDYYSNPFGYNGYTSRTAGQTEEEVLPPSYYITEGLSPINSSLTNVTYIPQDYAADLTGYPKVYADPKNPQVPYYVSYTREVNGGITVDGNNYTLVYSGFYRAPSSGNYTICSSADNADYSYLGGGDAFDCIGGKPNATATPLNDTSAGGYYNNPVSCGTVYLVVAEFYPIRRVFGNGDAVSAFNLTIQAPGGIGENDNAGYLYPVNCRL